MSAIQKGRFNPSRHYQKKRKEQRRKERFYYNEALPDPKPDWFERNGEFLINLILLLLMVIMIVYLTTIAIKNG